MKQPRFRLAKIIADATLKKGLSHRFAEEIAAYLLAERRANELESVVRDVHADWAKAGFVEALTYSAHPLTAEARNDIIEKVSRIYPSAKEIRITESIDPTILGGVRLQLPNMQLDLSVEAKLAKFKQLTTGKD